MATISVGRPQSTARHGGDVGRERRRHVAAFVLLLLVAGVLGVVISSYAAAVLRVGAPWYFGVAPLAMTLALAVMHDRVRRDQDRVG